MKRSLALGATLAAMVFAALTSLTPAQSQETPPGHDKYPAPSNTPANPAMGAEDANRSGTMTKGTENLNNNRLPGPPKDQTTATTNEVVPPVEAAPPPPAVAASAPAPAPRTALPTTASDTPFVGMVGVLALGIAVALKARRREV